MIETSTPTFYSATKEWLSRTSGVSSLVLQPGIKTLDWVNLLAGSLSKPLKDTRKVLSRSKYSINWLNLSRKIRRLTASIYAVDLEKSPLEVTEKTVFAFKNTMSLTKMGSCGLEILHDEGLLSLSARHLVILKTVGMVACFATFLKTIIDIKEIIYDLKETQPGDPIRQYDLIHLARKICVLVGSLFALLVFALGGEIVAKWVVLAISTIGLSLSISKYYYKRFYLN